MSDFENRLKKNASARMKWAARQRLTAFRLYDLDIPEWPFAVDWYAGFVHVMEYPRRRQVREGSLESAREHVRAAIASVLQVPPERIFTKTHEKQPWGERQYEKLGRRSTLVQVSEGDLQFECNLSDYLDTGLFLDHRKTRLTVGQQARSKRFLNLFAYTGSFTVHAVAGGASQSTSVDLSNTYCDWAERNLRLNNLSVGPHHRVIRADVLQWLEAAKDKFDLIVVDPPSFSTSKKMGRRFEVQRDHRWLLERTRELLAPSGTLYFSTNFLGFELDARVTGGEELLRVPEDFRRPVHRAWRFTAHT